MVLVTFFSVDDDPYLQWSEPGIGRYLFVMSVVGVVAFAVLLAMEYNVIYEVSA